MPTQPATNGLEIPRGGRRYSPEEITHGLTCLATNGGNAVQAAEQLAQLGLDIPSRTLYYWRSELHPDRYRDICEEIAPQIEQRVVHLQRELAVRATNAALQAVDLEHKRIALGEVKDAAASARNLSTVAGISVDKILSLTGRPTSITEHRTPEQAMKRLKTLHPGLFVEGTAEELPAAESAPLAA